MNRTVVALVLVLAGSGCSRSPAAPSTPDPNAVLTYDALASPMFIGALQESVVTSTSGTVAHRVTTDGTWASDGTSIASPDLAGLVRAIGSGQTTIRVTFGGKTTTSTVRVVPDYKVGFSTSETITGCTVTRGDAGDRCDLVGHVTEYHFGQTGLAVVMSVDAGDIVFQQLTSQVALDGSVEFGASAVSSGVRNTYAWHLNSPDGTVFFGTLRVDFAAVDDSFAGFSTSNISGVALR